MTPTSLFYIIIGILVLDFIVEKILGALNAKHFDDPIPKEVEDVYDPGEYRKSQAYKKTNYKKDPYNKSRFNTTHSIPSHSYINKYSFNQKKSTT